jgi:hypothetical protein
MGYSAVAVHFEHRPKALAPKAFSTFVFLGLVFFGVPSINAGKRKTLLELCEAVGIPQWPQGRGTAESPGSKSIFIFCLSGTCVFWDIVYQRW